MYNLVHAYGKRLYLLTDNQIQFAVKLFAAIAGMLGMRQLFTTAYHPQTNSQAKRFNKTIASRLKYYIADHQKNWDAYVGSLTYAYSPEVHRYTGATPFTLVLACALPSAFIETRATAAHRMAPNCQWLPNPMGHLEAI